MSKQESAKLQSCVLKVDIQCHCDGCKKKVKKLLQNVDGVYTTNIDADQGKVTVTGDVNPATLIKKLSKSGKHAELWGSQKGKNNFQHQFNDPFKNFQIDAQKNGKDKKSQKGPAQQKGKGGGGGVGGGQVQQMQQQKGPKEMMKQQKSVKFNMNHEEFDASEDDFGDESDEFDDEFDEDDEDDHFRHQVPKGHQQVPNKMAPMGMMGNGNGLHGHPTMMNMINSQAKGGGGGGKKGEAIDIPVSMKSGGGKNESKHGNNGVGKKGGGGDGGKKGKGGNDKKQGGKDKNGGIMGFFGFGKKSKNGGGGKDDADKISTGNGRVGGGGENKNGGGGKQGKGKGTDGVQDMKKMKNEFEIDVTKPGKGPKGGGVHGGGNGSKSMGQMMGPMGSMGPMGGHMTHMGPMGGQMGNYGQMGLTPAVQGLPAGAGGSMNGGYYHGMGGGGGPGNPYMPVMMNQQHPNMSDMYQYQMMHGRPDQPMNYMPPPPMPPHPSVRDPYTHYLSDENTDGGCSIM